jgi:steroid 5-alpha reductase family enzyme
MLTLPLFTLAVALLLSLAISALGFRRVDYFVSIGYAFSIAAQAVLIPLFYLGQLDLWTLLADAMLLVYGLRLGFFLLARERAPSFAREQQASLERGKHIKGWLKLTIWVTVAALYVAMYAPVHLLIANAAVVPTRGAVVVGLIIMALGLGTEALADAQKSAFKARNPDRFIDSGLYAIVRSPNYFGEMLFWLGAFIAGANHYLAPLDWMIALVGLVSIQLIMLGSARRLELKQAERYAGNPYYRAYVERVPILIPFVPIHSLKNLRIYLG